MSQTALLQDIAELLEREHHALEARDVDTLTTLESERSTLLGRLAPASREERSAFATLEFLRARNERLAQQQLDRLGVAMGRIGKGRTALAGYRTSVGSSNFSRALDQEV